MLIRRWRENRRLSQLSLALQADVSTRHLSFVETGRSLPSREMVLHLAEELDVPLRERNTLLLAAGYAPAYSEHPLDSAGLQVVRSAVQKVLTAHEPYPALAVDRTWHLVDANSAVAMLTEGAPERMLVPPFNVLRFSLHPDGLAPRIVNLGEWRAHVLDRLRRQAETTLDPALGELLDELSTLPCRDDEPSTVGVDDRVLVPMRLRVGAHELSLFSTVTVFGTPLDVTVSELSIESFYPADEATAKILRSRAGST
jgi:transcriptional regulator with XRE-family HTH domain